MAGHRAEALLGDTDAEKLGIITFNSQGTDPNPEEKEQQLAVRHIGKEGSMAEKIRRGLGVQVQTERPLVQPAPAEEQARVKHLVEEYIGTIFTERIRCIKTSPVMLDFDPKFTPTQPPYRPIPIHYRDKVSAHLQRLRDDRIITDIDPRETYDSVMNTVITEKVTPGEIRLNIDSMPQNPGMRRTKYHVKTPQEVRHDLDGVTVFSEMDMGCGFHQLPFSKGSKEKSIFQTHEGIHYMERLYFRPTSSSGIFHSEVAKALGGIPGCTTIHDNILVGGKDFKEHWNNLKATLQRCKEKGITLKLKKSLFCKREVIWFGRMFSATGVSADPAKIKTIMEAGKPNSTEEVRSLIQAATYNARFMFRPQAGSNIQGDHGAAEGADGQRDKVLVGQEERKPLQDAHGDDEQRGNTQALH